MNILNVGYDSTNYYLLGKSTPRLLIDVGWPGTLPKLRRNLQKYEVNLRNLYLLVTHYHPDHGGLAQEAKQLGLKLVVLETQITSIAQQKQYMKPENHYIDIILSDNVHLKLSESRAFLSKLGLQGEIVATPGHSDDSVSLVLNDGLAFTGDLQPAEFITNEREAEKARQSWETLRRLGVHTIYPGHGPARRIQ